jgi:hypothetical protein
LDGAENYCGPPPPLDGGVDAAVPPASGCAPADESGFVPKWHPPAPHQSSCTQAQIDAFHQCLNDGLTTANPPSCAPFTGPNATPSNKACLQCIETPDVASLYGPLIVNNKKLVPNVDGCVALATNDPQGTGCAGKLQAASQCLAAACSQLCST